ncbi:hypothetical protein [Alkalihalobacillus sp. LMS39]|uniref:hypothetical protein n=1 Tax=Alkalihalobacillus sp. LMS39 TaxID=2924032 RepID=UPI001FB35D7D|nr:hypothetical protein [Alkalihalobacillus sp. LMS39]UOE92984.1 hypothetical protein MM271_17420 [Alkalihalobacillus sp. LMS39]
MNLQDAIYNWLSIKMVSDARPNDNAALDTYMFFDEILKQDHKIEKLEIKKEGAWYIVDYWIEQKKDTKQYPIDLIDALLLSIESEPKYN